MASNSPWSHARSAGIADDIDFEIKGQELQFVEIELDPGESAVAEAGAFVWKDASIQMTTVFGDGSADQGGGFMGKLLGAGKRLITGESLFTTVFTHQGSGKARVAFASPTPGAILPIKLDQLGGTLICQKDSFLCAARGVSIGIAFQRRIMTGLFGGEGFIMQKLEGDGWVFVQMGGTLTERTLAPGEELHVDTGCLAAYTPSVTFDLIGAGGVKTVLFGGEGLFFARLTRAGQGVDPVAAVRTACRPDAGSSHAGGRTEPGRRLRARRAGRFHSGEPLRTCGGWCASAGPHSTPRSPAPQPGKSPACLSAHPAPHRAKPEHHVTSQ